MARRPDPERALERARTHLDDALADSTDPAVRYHLRQALQLADAVDAGLNHDGSTGSGSPAPGAPASESESGSSSGSGEA